MILKIMLSKNKNIYIKILEKLGYMLHNVIGDCNVALNRLDFSFAFAYCLYSIIDSVANIQSIIVPYLQQQTFLTKAISPQTPLLVGKTFLQPVEIINTIIICRLWIKLYMRGKAIEDKGLSLLPKGARYKTKKTKFLSPITHRVKFFKLGIKIFAFIVFVLSLFLFTNKDMYFLILPYVAAIIANIMILIDEFLENLTRRYDAEEHIYLRKCIY